MARPEVDPSLQLRNQESVRFTDTELTRLDKALTGMAVATGFKVSRSHFAKVTTMREVGRLLGISSNPEQYGPIQELPTKPHKPRTPRIPGKPKRGAKVLNRQSNTKKAARK